MTVCFVTVFGTPEAPTTVVIPMADTSVATGGSWLVYIWFVLFFPGKRGVDLHYQNVLSRGHLYQNFI